MIGALIERSLHALVPKRGCIHELLPIGGWRSDRGWQSQCHDRYRTHSHFSLPVIGNISRRGWVSYGFRLSAEVASKAPHRVHNFCFHKSSMAQLKYKCMRVVIADLEPSCIEKRQLCSIAQISCNFHR